MNIKPFFYLGSLVCFFQAGACYGQTFALDELGVLDGALVGQAERDAGGEDLFDRSGSEGGVLDGGGVSRFERFSEGGGLPGRISDFDRSGSEGGVLDGRGVSLFDRSAPEGRDMLNAFPKGVFSADHGLRDYSADHGLPAYSAHHDSPGVSKHGR